MLGVPLRFGMGYGLGNAEMPIGPRACFWGGYGGSMIVMDQDAELTVCYVMNRMESGLVGDVRGMTIAIEAVKAPWPLVLNRWRRGRSAASASTSTLQRGSSRPATTTMVAAGRIDREELAVHGCHGLGVGGRGEEHAGAHHVAARRRRLGQGGLDDLEAPSGLRPGIVGAGSVGPDRAGARDPDRGRPPAGPG